MSGHTDKANFILTGRAGLAHSAVSCERVNTGERSKIKWQNTWFYSFKFEKLKRYTQKSSKRPSCDWWVQTGTQWQGCNYHFYRGCVYVCWDQTVVLSSCYPGYHIAHSQSTKHSVRNPVLKPDSAHERQAAFTFQLRFRSDDTKVMKCGYISYELALRTVRRQRRKSITYFIFRGNPHDDSVKRANPKRRPPGIAYSQVTGGVFLSQMSQMWRQREFLDFVMSFILLKKCVHVLIACVCV